METQAPRPVGGTPPERPRPKVLIVSETRLYREGLVEALRGEGALDICGHASGAESALRALAELAPDAVLLDAASSDGLALVSEMTRSAPQARVVVFALAEAADDVIAWAEAGAAGYIAQTTPLAGVAPTVINILAGDQACSPRVTSALLRRLHELGALSPHAGADDIVPLTAREMQIASLIKAGLSNKQIARQLDVGLATIKSHVHNLLGKLAVQRRGQVVARLGAARWRDPGAARPEIR